MRFPSWRRFTSRSDDAWRGAGNIPMMFRSVRDSGAVTYTDALVGGCMSAVGDAAFFALPCVACNLDGGCLRMLKECWEERSL